MSTDTDTDTDTDTRPTFPPTGTGWYVLRSGEPIELRTYSKAVGLYFGGIGDAWWPSGEFNGHDPSRDIVAPWVPVIGDTVWVVKAMPEYDRWIRRDMDAEVGTEQKCEALDSEGWVFLNPARWWFPVTCLAPVAKSEPQQLMEAVDAAETATIVSLRAQVAALTAQLADAQSPEGIAKAATELSRQGLLEWTYIERREIQQKWHGTFGVDIHGTPWSYAFRLVPAPTPTRTYRGTPEQHAAAKAAGLQEVTP